MNHYTDVIEEETAPLVTSQFDELAETARSRPPRQFDSSSSYWAQATSQKPHYQGGNIRGSDHNSYKDIYPPLLQALRGMSGASQHFEYKDLEGGSLFEKYAGHVPGKEFEYLKGIEGFKNIIPKTVDQAVYFHLSATQSERRVLKEWWDDVLRMLREVKGGTPRSEEEMIKDDVYSRFREAALNAQNIVLKMVNNYSDQAAMKVALSIREYQSQAATEIACDLIELSHKRNMNDLQEILRKLKILDQSFSKLSERLQKDIPPWNETLEKLKRDY